jgi:hypothetical protein
MEVRGAPAARIDRSDGRLGSMLLEMLHRHSTMSCALVSFALDADDEDTGRRRTIAATRPDKILQFISLFVRC